MCPHGFDPITKDTQQEKKLRLSIVDTSPQSSGDKALPAFVMLQFHGHVVEMEMQHLTADKCTQIFRRFRNLGELTCTSVSSTNALYEFDITLHSFPIYPIMNNIFHHAGNPLSSEFTCEAPPSSSLSCRFTSLGDSNIKSYLPCSNHGICNTKTGLCACEPGFYGVHCGSNEDSANMLLGFAGGPYFSGNLLKLGAARASSTSFYLIHADVAGRTIFTMDGEGHTHLHEGSLVSPSVLTSQLEVNSGHVKINDADMKLSNSKLSLHNDLTLDTPLIDVDMTSPTCTSDLMRLRLAGQVVFQVDAVGKTSLDALEVQKRTSIQGSLAVQELSSFKGQASFQTGVKVAGHVEIDDGVNVKGATSFSSAQGEILVASPSSSLLHLQLSDKPSKCLTCLGDRQEVLFDVSRTGATTIHQGGLDVHAGGIRIGAGGQVIESGGLRIRSGGLKVEAGGIEFNDTMAISHGLEVTSTENLQPALYARVSHLHFNGAVMSLDANADASVSPFDFVVARGKDNHVTWKVSGKGDMSLQGSVVANASIVAHGPLIASRQALFRPHSIRMQEHLVIPCSHSYVHITDDGKAMPKTTQSIQVEGAQYGQLLIIQNDDTDWLHSLKIPPRSSALFVFDGQAWQTLTATEFDTTRLVNVKELSAAANLNIGEYQLTAHAIQVGGQPANRVALYGKGGLLTHDASLAYDATTSTLQVHQLQVDQVVGKIDMTNSELRGVDIIGGDIRGINMSAMVLEVTGEMYVESNAYVGGGLVVDGQVMGSGSYLDSSDMRFKTNITALPMDPLEALMQLQAVEYNYDTEAFPKKHFTPTREIGFLAQEVESVLPQVVETDKDGYKYVAYAHLLPVVVEAMKQQAKEIHDLRARLAALEERLQFVSTS
ncbi:hypothetical protein AeMF1_019070 [Aphanomyces euteiches]|nr:hypothetical protein AeMF1_019070 [Aphanomyces euteiches]